MFDTKILDDKTLQRLLFISSDIIGGQITRYGQDLGSRVAKLGAITNSGSVYLNEEEQIKTLTRQHEIFSDSSVPSGQSAYELFADNFTNIPIDTTYVINHYMLIYFGEKPYFFNIDQINRDNKKIFFSKVNIQNRSKDAFTTKANYLVTLKINFTTFDDLLEPNIVVKDAYDPKKATKIAPLHLLYKFFDLKVGSQEEKDIPDPTGIFLNQTLTLDNHHNRYKDISEKLNSQLLSKNYHLTFHKHTIDMFKNEDPIFKYFENELTIEYIAYEADGVDKPMSKEMNKIIPKVNSNLYNLLDLEVLSDSQLSWTNMLGGQRYDEKGNVIQSNVIYTMSDIIGEFKKVNKELENWHNQLAKCDETTQVGKKKEEIKENIQKASDKLQYLKTYANRSLIFTIMRMCRLYRIQIPPTLAGVYEKNMFLENFKNNFSWIDLGTDVVNSVAVSSLFGPVGIGAAGVGALWYFGSLAIQSYQIAMIRKDLNVSDVRLEIAKITDGGLGQAKFSIENPDKFVDLAMGKRTGENNTLSSVGTGMSSRSDFAVLNGTSDESKKRMKEMMDKIGLQELPSSDSTEDAVIFFTTFGEIIKILTILDPSKNLRVISGGYLMNIDATSGLAAYNNFATLPITLNSFSQFLYRMIEETERSLNYDSELFFRDCYENLIKAIINDGQTALPSIQNATPSNIKIVSTLHQTSESFYSQWFRNTNLLDESSFNNLKYNFIASKNFNLSTTGMLNDYKIGKIYVIGTHNEIKYYDFYKEYDKWTVKWGKPNKGLYCSKQFQEFINREHLMPCLLIKNVADSEGILRKKHVSFSRIDNANLNTGNFINKHGQLRYPYQFKGEFKPFMTFFSDIGSLMFIAPPLSAIEKQYGQANMFGFGGLYVIKSAEFEYQFQRIVDNKISIPNLEARCILDGYMISHGDSIRNRNQDQQAHEKSKDTSMCDIPKPVSNEPAALSNEPSALWMFGL